MNVSEIVKEELARVCAVPVEDIQDDADLVSFGLDSMRTMELIVALDARFNIRIDEDDIETVATVGDVIRAVERSQES